MAEVKAWREGAAGEPSFPNNFEVTRKAVLQVTDIKTNRNKYYAVELHTAKSKFRVYTHYGRTDDLDSNPDAGARESRYFNNLTEAVNCYDSIYREKTSDRKGYKELSLASAKIGSRKTFRQSSGSIDDRTLQKLVEKEPAKPARPIVTIAAEIQDLVGYLYAEATNALTSTVNAAITANGIETPLGVLTLGQIEKGQAILDLLVAEFEKKHSKSKLTDLSGDFYTVIPHRFGRSRAEAEAAVLDTADKLNEKQETLQLMRDMLNVNGTTNVLIKPEIEEKYKALGCTIETVDAGTFRKIADHVEGSAVRKYPKYKVKGVWKVRRPGEHESFEEKVGNSKLLFHGSAAKNWVGILSRGLLLPKLVVSLGVKRTDAGWLGNGIYFGNAISTSAVYARPGQRKTRFIAVANVALGQVKQYRKITWGLSKPPDGFNSCHGVRGSEFADDEFVVYAQKQQRLEYLVEVMG